MFNWRDLPKEVLNIIMLYVNANDKSKSKKDISQCSLTCRNWRIPAQNVLFTEISVNATKNIDSLIRVALESNNNELKIWVKALKYTKQFSCTPTALAAADFSFPKLKALDFCGDDVLYSFFCNMLVENEKFKNLTKLPIPANKEQDIMYNRCLDFLQESITSITLFDDETNNRDIYQGVIKKLDRFPKLRSVLIYTAITDMKYQNVVKYINPIVKNNLALPLKELCITSSANDSYCFRLLAQGQEGLLPMTELKSLTVYMCNERCFTISEDFMLFIMNQCPNLNSLHVENAITKYIRLPSTFNYQQTLLNFMIYLLKMPNFSLQNSVLATKEATQLIEDYYTAMEKEPTSLKLSRTLFITAYSVGSTGESLGVVDFKNDHSMRLQSVDFQLFRAKSTPSNKVDEEQIQLVKKIGCFFNTVSLQITSSDYLATLLKCVTEIDCQRLNTLTIVGLSGSIYKDSFLLDKEIAFSNSIKELVLSNCCLSQEQLLCISIVLPRLEKLVLKNFLRHKSLLLSGKLFFSICLPNLSLDCLEIDMNLGFTGSQKEEKYYIKLVTDVEQNPRYCFFTVKFANNKVTGYSFINNPTEAAFQESISNQKISSYLIYCKSVKNFTFKYIDAKNDFHKTLDLLGESIV